MSSPITFANGKMRPSDHGTVSAKEESFLLELSHSVGHSFVLAMHCAQFVQHPVLIVVDASDDRRHHVHVVAQGRDFRREPL